MERTWTADLALKTGMPVLVKGWLHRLRALSNVSFLVLRDARGLAQVVVTDRDTRTLLAGLHSESVLEVRGEAVAVDQAPGGVEIRSPEVTVLSRAAGASPIELFRPLTNASLPALLDHAAVALRHPTRRGHFEIAAAALHGFRSTLGENGFIEVNTPKIVGSATEGGANVFKVDYFGRPAYLAQSPQLYKQTLVGVFERVFEVGPVFRAEPHDTPRHINEYVSLDIEMGFIDDHLTVMRMLREVVSGMLAAIGERTPAAIARLAKPLPAIPDEIPSLPFSEALKLVGAPPEEPDLAPAQEIALGEWALREHGSEFLFVTGYPLAKRPFYTHPDPSQPGVSNSFDLLFRGLEVVTGGQRLHLYEDYLRALAQRGLSAEPLAGYLEAFRHGMPPHGGFAIGLERFIARLAGVANIREVTLFPRDLNRVSP